MLNKILTPRQKKITELVKQSNGKNMTEIIENVRNETSASEPTVRRTLQMLRQLGVLECGDCKNKGEEVKLTKTGQLILEK